MPVSMAIMKVFEKLLAWQACHKMVIAIHRITSTWPNEERFGLTAQARRAAFSAAANISEGTAKRGFRERRKYLDNSLGSLSELCYIIRLAKELEILSDEAALELESLRDEAGKLTWGLYNHARKHS